MHYKPIKGDTNDHIRFIEETLKSGYTDLKGALFFLEQEYQVTKDEMKKALIGYCKKHGVKYV